MYRVTINSEGQKVCSLIKNRQQFLQLIDSPANKAACQAALKGDANGKRRQVQICAQCNPARNGFMLAGSKQYPTNMIMVDVDYSTATPGWEQQKEEDTQRILAAKEEHGVHFVQSTRKGLHIIMRRPDPGLSQGENLQLAAQKLGIEPDMCAKDITRIFYCGSSRTLLLLHDDVFAVEDCPYVPEEEEAKSAKPKTNAKAQPAGTPAAPAREHLSHDEQPLYKSLAFTWPEISQKWWQQYNGGLLPQQGERNTRWFDFLTAMSWFTGNAEILRQACHGCTLAADELDALINNVTANYRPAAVPSKLRTLLEELLRESSRTYTLSRRTLPQSIRHCLGALPRGMDMPLVAALSPMVGALATGVNVTYNGKSTALNLTSFITGESGSNKSSLTDIIYTWTAELRAADAALLSAEEEWRQKKRRTGSSAKEQPAKPQGVIRMPTVNATLPQLCARLSQTGGNHAFSYTEEADEFTSRMAANMQDVTAMQRKAYDGAPYERETVGAEGVNAHIPTLLWNAVYCGTPDALHRMVPNVTDGTCNRMAIASTPDNTFAPLEPHKPLTGAQKEYIQRTAHLLTLMAGTAALPKLEHWAGEWLEGIRQEAEAQQDKVLARARMRTHVTAFRMTVCMQLVRAAERLMADHGYQGAEALLARNPQAWVPIVSALQNKACRDNYETIADSLIDESMRYFRGRITAAYAAKNYAAAPCGRRATGGNEAIYAALPAAFSLDDVYELMLKEKADIKRNTASCQLKRWKQAGRVVRTKTGYAKC